MSFGGKLVDKRAYTNKVRDEAKDAFFQHELITISPRHWRIKNPKRGKFWCEIVVMGHNSAISVWGDLNLCLFAYSSGSTKPEDVVAWMANADINYYGRQKAIIGMGGPELVDDYNKEVAMYDVEQCLKDREEEWGEKWKLPFKVMTPKRMYEEVLYKLIESFGTEPKIALDEACYELMYSNLDPSAYEWIYNIGRVVSTRVIYAMEAISRLHKLLNEDM